MKFLLLYLAIINIISFAMYGIDKVKAKLNKWRIPEVTLLGVAFVGGSLGAMLGMQVFRHKTKHMKFMILVPVFLVLHIVAIILIIR